MSGMEGMGMAPASARGFQYNETPGFGSDPMRAAGGLGDLKGPLAGFALNMLQQQLSPRGGPMPPVQHMSGLQQAPQMPRSMRLYQPTPLLRNFNRG